jgi:DNA polymerase-3 subunit alpha/error-prone DNA polymerase
MNIRLGLCSAYSLLYGVRKQSDLIDRAVSIGVQTVSMCDLNNIYGVHSFLEIAKEKGIRPIIGVTLTVGNGDKIVYCFVENKQGFSRICELLTLRNKDVENFNPLPLLRENSAGLVLASPDENVLELFAGQVKYLYAAITPTDIGAVSFARRLNVPLAFLDNSLLLEAGDYPVHRVLRAIGLLKTVGNLLSDDTAEPERVFRGSKELHRKLVSWPEAVKGTEQIAAVCTMDTIFDGWVFPSYQTAGLPVADELCKRAYKGNADRYGELGDYEISRIEYEMSIIKEKGFASYFLVIYDIVRMASRTCGRGSGAASVVSYGLGITNVDPLRHNLYFERFLNPARPDPPDIDIDFAWDERDDLIKAVITQFGSDHCARVANHNMFRYRSALRETAKAYGFGDADITQLERKLQITHKKDETFNDPLCNEIFSIAAKIEGLPRGLGMHCGGLVITPEPIYRYAPIEKSAEGYPLLAWEKEGAEAAGFVKIDLLGNRSLAVIRDVLLNLEQQGVIINRDTWRPLDDKPTIAALACGDSIGVFYIESPAMRQLQKKTNAGDFEHIVIHSSIIRPAANKFIAEYVRRLKGGKWEPLHPLLENILNETYGILCYQEDVSKTAVALAGFNEGDADKLRKVIAKKMGGAKLAAYHDQFFEGCRKNGVNDDTIQKIWDMMLSFDGYSFCKPHSASYAMVSFQSAYLRVHHPAEFIAAVLSNQGGYYRPHAYIAEARRMRLVTEGPDINASRWNYFGIGVGDCVLGNSGISNEKRVYRGTVVIGLMAIKGLSASGANSIIKEREHNGNFATIDDFSRRVKLNRDDIIALCPAGVFDSIADGLPRALQARRLLGANAGNRNTAQADLFAPEPDKVFGGMRKNTLVPVLPNMPKTDGDLWNEYRALGFLRNSHPLLLWRDDVMAVKYRVKALHIDQYVGRNVKMVGWPVTQKDVWTKDGLTMSFLSLEDETALYETVIFPQVYDRYSKLLFDQQPLLVYGRVSNDEGALSVEISKIEVLGKQCAGRIGNTDALRFGVAM